MPMLASSGNQQHHRPGSTSSSARNSQHVRFSTMSTSHSVYGHQPLATEDPTSPGLPPIPSMSSVSTSLYNGGASKHRHNSTSGSGSLSQHHQRPQSSRSSSDMLINTNNNNQNRDRNSAVTYPLIDLNHSPQPSADINMPTPLIPTSTSDTFDKRQSTRPSTADSNSALQPPPRRSISHGHKRSISSTGSSIMSALLSVAPLQTLKIANRTKLDDLDDEDDEDGDKRGHAMSERRPSGGTVS